MMMGLRASTLSWCYVKDSSAVNKPTTYSYRSSQPSYNHNWTDLHYASSQGNIRRIHEILHKAGTVNLNSKDYYGKTPLYWAAYKGHKTCLEELLKHGAKVNTQCRHGGTPLHTVVGLYPDCALLLIKHGADVNKADNWGVTPMYLAATHGQLDVLRYLLVAGAHVTLKNKFGDVPKQLSHHQDFCKYLKQMSQTPRGLQQLCLMTIRKRLSDHPHTKIESFIIPRQLKDYLQLVDLS